jgi:hypothetical protein
LCLRKGNKEGGTFARLGFHEDRAVQFTCGFLDNSKTETGAVILLRSVEAFEHTEYLLIIARFNPNAVIPYEDFIALVLYRQPTGFNAFRGRIIEFDGVLDKILKDLAEKDQIGVERGPFIAQSDLDIGGQVKRCY